LVQSFGVGEQLAAVRLYVELNRDDGAQGSFNLMTSFPRKVYQGDDYDMPLDALGIKLYFPLQNQSIQFHFLIYSNQLIMCNW